MTFHEIAPILREKCAPCHRAGEAGPFPLVTYADAAKRADLIAAVTRKRYMPPWLPEHGYGDFAGELRLSEDEIREIGDWAAGGAPEGPAVEPPRFSEGWQLGTPDLVLDALSSYSVPASGPDQYWNFVFTPALPRMRYVRAVEIRPGNRRVLHHANLLLDRLASSAKSGFPGMDLTIMRSPFDPDGHFLFWKPGGLVHVEPEGWGWHLDPGNLLVLNTHLHPSGKVEEIRPSIGLYFTDQKPTEFPLLVQLENDKALDIPPGAKNFTVSDGFSLPMPVDVMAVYPHAHYLGKTFEAYATLPGSGERRWLIRIPQWNPDWQAVYYYREPVKLPQGATITMRWTYDNSAANPRNPHAPPRRVQGGNQSDDEMAHFWLELKPEGAGDRRRELQEAVMEHRLRKNASDFEANLNIGAVMLSRLDAADAVSHLEAAVLAEPRRFDAHNMLGLALAAIGRVGDAVEEYERALNLRPDSASARFNLANALVKEGRIEEAIAQYRIVVNANPNDSLPRERLAAAERMEKTRN